jgi:hypothetical protein
MGYQFVPVGIVLIETHNNQDITEAVLSPNAEHVNPESQPPSSLNSVNDHLP